jgi:alpha-tubulin suppressor-like RCC1 family protein
MRSAILSVPSLVTLALLTGCGAAPDPASVDARTPGAAASSSPSSGSASTSGSTSPPGASATSGGLHAEVAQVPTGVLCIVFSISGAAEETVPVTVAANGSTSALSLGALIPGPIKVSANAYGVACPAQGLPSAAATYTSDPVSATVVAGVTTSIPIELRAVAQGTSSVSFEVPAVSIAAGTNTTYAVLADGTVRAWGDNTTNELGAAGASTDLPVKVPGITTAVQVTAGAGFACVLLSNDTVECWGANNVGQLGLGTTSASQAPALVPGLYASKISSNTNMTCAMGLGGTEGCWGQWYTASAPGSGSETNVLSLLTPVNESSPDWVQGSSIADVAAAGDSPCYALTSGSTQCAASVDLTIGFAIGSVVPDAITHVVASNGSACAFQANGNVWCWGADNGAQLGPVTAQSNLYVQPQVVPALTGATSIALSQGTSQSFSCASLASGSVVCAGQDGFGELGNGTTSALNTPSFVSVLGLTNVAQVAAGSSHACARTYDGGVYCWGNNASGQIGDGTTLTRFVPVAVAPW